MLTTFTDEDDKELVQIVVKYAQQQRRIDWGEVERKMRHTKYTKKALRTRLTSLQQQYGLNVMKFPKRFFMPLARKIKRRAQVKARLVRKSLTPLCDAAEIYTLLEKTYGTISKQEINHSGKSHHENAGELSALSVTEIIRSVGPITCDDVFLDVGSGIGNIVAQFAMETSVGLSIGLEIRKDLVEIAKRRIMSSAPNVLQLKRTQFIAGDLRKVDFSALPLANTTIIWSSNVLYEPLTNLSLEKMICSLSRLRVVLLLLPFCHRHRDSCTREFCGLWELDKTLEVAVSWTHKLVTIYFYKRRNM